MATPRKVAVVTGANKGIGYAIVKGLCSQWSGDVYLTARDESRGRDAVARLNALGLKPIFHQLDITDVASVRRLGDHIREKYGRLDVLVNNAAIAFKNAATEPFAHQAELTMHVNYFSLVATCEMLFPLLVAGSRVVNLSSSAGQLFRIPSPEIRARFANPALTVAGISELAREFVASAARGENARDGWGESAYVVSKVAVSALTFAQNRSLGPRGVFVNCVHPGYVDTDMTSHRGPLTIEEGAKAPLHLAIGDKEYKGVYMWYDCTVKDWYAE